MSTLNTEAIAKALETMTVTEMADFVRILEERWGVEAVTSSPSVIDPWRPISPPLPPLPSMHDVVLVDYGAQKIKVIKEVRKILGMGLREAKALVESCPVALKEGLESELARELQEQLQAVGAQVEVRS